MNKSPRATLQTKYALFLLAVLCLLSFITRSYSSATFTAVAINDSSVAKDRSANATQVLSHAEVVISANPNPIEEEYSESGLIRRGNRIELSEANWMRLVGGGDEGFYEDTRIDNFIDENERTGIYFWEVPPQSQLGKLGLKDGDVLRAINKTIVTDSTEAYAFLLDNAHQSKHTFEITRNGKTIELTLQIEKSGSSLQSDESSLASGLARNGNSVYATRTFMEADEPKNESSNETSLSLTPSAEGIVIDYINPESKLAKMGLSESDLVESLNGATIRTVEEFHAALENAQYRQHSTIKVYRSSKELVINVNVM